jgi:hypothetical protein
MVWKYRENGTINHCRLTKVHAHAKLIPVFPQQKSNALYMLWKKEENAVPCGECGLV